MVSLSLCSQFHAIIPGELKCCFEAQASTCVLSQLSIRISATAVAQLDGKTHFRVPLGPNREVSLTEQNFLGTEFFRGFCRFVNLENRLSLELEIVLMLQLKKKQTNQKPACAVCVARMDDANALGLPRDYL